MGPPITYDHDSMLRLRQRRFGHPSQDRAISLREAALLQTFPRAYKFAPDGAPIRFNQIGRLIGNAVPVKLGEAIARAICKQVEDLA